MLIYSIVEGKFYSTVPRVESLRGHTQSTTMLGSIDLRLFTHEEGARPQSKNTDLGRLGPDAPGVRISGNECHCSRNDHLEMIKSEQPCRAFLISSKLA